MGTILALFSGRAGFTFALLVGTLVGFSLLFRQCSTTRSVERQRDSLQTKTVTLQARVIGLVDTTSKLLDLVLHQNKVISAGEVEAAKKREQIRQVLDDRNKAIAEKTATERKLEALKLAYQAGQISKERLKDSLSAMPIFPDEDAANTVYLQMSAEVASWRDSTKAVFTQLGQKEQEAKNLEDRLDDANRRIANVRTFVQDERAKAKGLFTKKRRKVLGQVDDKLSNVQKLN